MAQQLCGFGSATVRFGSKTLTSYNTGNPGDITNFFQAWADASKKWMPFLLIFGVVGAYALMTIGHQRGWGHFKDQIVAGFIAMMVIAIAPGLFG